MNKYYYQPTSTAKSPLYEAGCLAHIIETYQRAFKCKEFQRGPFKFSDREHSTTSLARIYISIPNHPEREIVNADYWYSQSYRFNTSKFESGAWDSALENEIDLIWIEASKKIKDDELEEERLIAAQLEKEKKEKEIYEQYFLDAAK